VTEKRLEIAELVRRIHIGQQPFAAKPRDVISLDHVHLQIFEQFQHLQAPLDETSYDGRMAAASVDRAQRMISAFGPRHDSIYPVAQYDKAFEECGRYKGHVAGDDNQLVVASGRQRRVETAQRAAVGNTISDTMNSSDFLMWTRPDEQDIVGQLTQFVELTLENPSTADAQLAFIVSAEAARLPAGENRGTGHYPVILLSA
jgi:hypothetical protein